MKNNPNFTEDELFYIEKIMDVNSAMGMKPMHELAEKAILAKASNEEKVAEMLFKQFFELGELYLITKSIRDKIENWRKNGAKK